MSQDILALSSVWSLI